MFAYVYMYNNLKYYVKYDVVKYVTSTSNPTYSYIKK